MLEDIEAVFEEIAAPYRVVRCDEDVPIILVTAPSQDEKAVTLAKDVDRVLCDLRMHKYDPPVRYLSVHILSRSIYVVRMSIEDSAVAFYASAGDVEITTSAPLERIRDAISYFDNLEDKLALERTWV